MRFYKTRRSIASEYKIWRLFAVSGSAGTDAITSAFPILHDQKVWMVIVFIVLLTMLNLRGVTESASILAYPVYLFVVALAVVIIVGMVRVAMGDVEPQPSHLGTPVAGISLFILLKAFASGSSALTGVEAISNAIPNFKAPAAKNAARTLVIMGALLAFLFAGIVLLAYFYGVTPAEKVTIVARTLQYAQSLQPTKIIAVYVVYDREQAKELEEQWAEWQPTIRLVILYSPYRSLTWPLTKFIDKVEHGSKERHLQVSVVMPQVYPKKGWQNILHNQSSFFIRGTLLYKRNIAIITVPFHLEK